jgi:hypothetical protein
MIATKNLKIVACLFVVASILSGVPAEAGLVNQKISEITDTDLQNFCAGKLGAGTETTTAKRGSRTVGCYARVDEATNGNAGGEIAGESPGGTYKGDGRINSNNRITFRSQNYKLNDYCREMVDRGFLFNPITGEGRVFVGDGGAACYKTVNQ